MGTKEDEAARQEDARQMEKAGWTLQQESCSASSDHEFKIGEPLEGTIRNIRTIPVRRGKELVEVRLMSLLSGSGIATVWESAALSGLFDIARVNDSVRIEYLGEVAQDPPKSPMKDYRVWVKAHEES